MTALSLVTAIATLNVATMATTTATEKQAPAVWSPHTVIVDLRELPYKYTCDELWYKFRAILLTLGARADMKILPYRCEATVGPAAYSPKVQLEFSSAKALDAKNARYADMQAVSTSVHLEPGSPARVESKDCELLNQIRSSLLPLLGDSVTSFKLPCESTAAGRQPFEMTVTALIPVPKPESEVARASRAQN